MIDVSFEELVYAYRKVKAYSYRQTSQPRLFKLYEYEKYLSENLHQLKVMLAGGAKSFDALVRQCEGVAIVPYRAEKGPPKQLPYKFISSTAKAATGCSRVRNLFFRTLADLPIDCEIVFVLWLIRVGFDVDAALEGEVWGDRLDASGGKSNFSKSPKLYRNYPAEHSRWQRDSFARIKALLEKERRPIQVFMAELRDSSAHYLKRGLTVRDLTGTPKWCEVNRIPAEKNAELSVLVVRMVNHWRRSLRLFTERLPVGSTIAGILTNFHLQRLDRKLLSRSPIYYSRCGKAFVLAMLDGSHYKSDKDVFDDIKGLVSDALCLPEDRRAHVFQESKTRILALEPQTGVDYLNAVLEELDSDESEWKCLPEEPLSDNAVKRVRTPFPDNTVDKDILLVDQTLLNRRALVKVIQNMEEYLHELSLADWQSQRIGFLRTFCDCYCTIDTWVDYYSLIPRILSIAFAASTGRDSAEFGIAIDIVSKVVGNIDCLRKIKPLEVANADKSIYQDTITKVCRRTFFDLVLELLTAVVRDDATVDVIVTELGKEFPDICERQSFERRPTYRQLQNADLAAIPFKQLVERFQFVGKRLVSKDVRCCPRDLRDVFSPRVSRVLRALVSSVVSGNPMDVPMALFFPTRPMDVTDVSALINTRVGREHFRVLRLVVSALGGGAVPRELGSSAVLMSGSARPVRDCVLITVPYSKVLDRVSIGLVSWNLDFQSWIASASMEHDPLKANRFCRLMKLVNQICNLEEFKRPQYVVFPELAMPAYLFLRIARHLSAKGISLISGVDYIGDNQYGEPKYVQNQAWCSLCNDIAKGQPIILKYIKTAPAQHEEVSLYSAGSVVLRKDASSKMRVVVHGDKKHNLSFSLLICSDLLDIDLRARLRGNVDLLIVPAWNRDVNTYSPLIEAAASDIHCYVAMSNAREYGDTRLRCPAKEPYNRDVIRLRGGVDDYCVVGVMDIGLMRGFQSAHLSSTKFFKPVPTGFNIAAFRRRLPLVDE